MVVVDLVVGALVSCDGSTSSKTASAICSSVATGAFARAGAAALGLVAGALNAIVILRPVIADN